MEGNNERPWYRRQVSPVWFFIMLVLVMGLLPLLFLRFGPTWWL